MINDEFVFEFPVPTPKMDRVVKRVGDVWYRESGDSSEGGSWDHYARCEVVPGSGAGRQAALRLRVTELTRRRSWGDSHPEWEFEVSTYHSADGSGRDYWLGEGQYECSKEQWDGAWTEFVAAVTAEDARVRGGNA